MKKILPFALVALSLTLGACNKERQCKCTTDNDDGLLRILVVDNSLKCENINEMMLEEKAVIDGEQTLIRYDTMVFSCRDYAEE